MKKKWIAAVLIYIALVISCIIVVYAVPSLRGMLEKTYVTEYGKIDITDEVSAFIMRDETVYVAAQDCTVTRLAEPGVLIKAKTRVVEMATNEEEVATTGPAGAAVQAQQTEPATVEAEAEDEDNVSHRYVKILENLEDNVVYSESGRTRTAGYVSYFVDGSEADLNTDNVDDFGKSDFKALTGRRNIDTQSGRCGKGDPIFKVTHNSKWYLVFYIDNKSGEKYYEGRTVYARLGEEDVPVRVVEVEEGTDSTRVVLSCKTFFDGFLSERRLKTTITVASSEGLVLQDSSIVMKGEQPGVFVKNKLGEHKFKPISVKADDGERCVVYSDIYVDADGNYVETLSTYDEIVAEPSEEEIAELQIRAAEEAAEKAKKEAAEAAAKEAAERAEAEQAAKEAAEAEAAKQAKRDKKKSQKQTDNKTQSEEDNTADKAADKTADSSGDAAEKQGESEDGQ